MSDQGNRAVVERYAAALPSDFATLASLRHPDFVEEWPQSGERIRGHANYQKIHENYPGGLPKLKLLTTAGTMLVSIAAYGLIWGLPFAAGFVAVAGALRSAELALITSGVKRRLGWR